MRIEGQIRVGHDDPWLQRLREEGRIAPFQSILNAINSSLNGQRYERSRAESASFEAAVLGVISAGIAVAVYLSGQVELAGIFLFGGMVGALKFAREGGKNVAYSSEIRSVEEHLINAGFKLAWSKDTSSSQRPTVVTIEWPSN